MLTLAAIAFKSSRVIGASNPFNPFIPFIPFIPLMGAWWDGGADPAPQGGEIAFIANHPGSGNRHSVPPIIASLPFQSWRERPAKPYLNFCSARGGGVSSPLA
jgi:hypothetical protein